MPGGRLRWLGQAPLLFVAILALYLASGRSLGSGDTLPARYLPISLLREHDFDLDEFPALHGDAARRAFPLLDGLPYFLRLHDGRLFSAYPPGPAVLALPVYALPVLGGMEATSPLVAHLEKLAAALVTALSAIVLFAAARRLTGARWAAIVALVYALGTSAFSVSSQALWQHGPGQLFLSLFVYSVVRGLAEERYLAHAGLALGAAAAMRATNVLVGLPLAAVLLARRPGLAVRFGVLAAVPLALHLAYNVWHFAALDPGFGTVQASALAFFRTPLLEGVAGLLVSPSRGLFVYSPVLLLALPGMWLAWRYGSWPLRALMLGPPLVVLATGKWSMWWGGHTYGPRVIADLAPVLCLFLVPLGEVVASRRLVRLAFTVLAAVSVAVHALGALAYDARWDAAVEIDHDPSAVWSWRRGQVGFYAAAVAQGALAFLSPAAPAATERGPTSASDPDGLAAAYTSSRVDLPAVAGRSLRAELTALNTGRAVWLARAPGERGEVRLGWRWEHDGVELAAGRILLPEDVRPGESVRLDARLPVPAAPGQPTLVLDLVSELVTWFSSRGTAPVRVPVRVLPADPVDLVAAGPAAAGSPVRVAAAVEHDPVQRGDAIRLRVDLRNRDRRGVLDAYLVLASDSRRIFLDGRGIVPWTAGDWPPWVRGLPLPARATARLRLEPGTLSPGHYTAYAIVTEPGGYRVIASGSARFTVE